MIISEWGEKILIKFLKISCKDGTEQFGLLFCDLELLRARSFPFHRSSVKVLRKVVTNGVNFQPKIGNIYTSILTDLL